MLRRRILGPVYTISATLRRDVESCAGLSDFSTYDRFVDAFSWRQSGENWYMLVPVGRKKNFFHLTVYLEVPRIIKDKLVRDTVEQILQREFFPRLCGIHVSRIGKAVLVVNPSAVASGDLEDVEFRPESFADMVIHS